MKLLTSMKTFEVTDMVTDVQNVKEFGVSASHVSISTDIALWVSRVDGQVLTPADGQANSRILVPGRIYAKPLENWNSDRIYYTNVVGGEVTANINLEVRF